MQAQRNIMERNSEPSHMEHDLQKRASHKSQNESEVLADIYGIHERRNSREDFVTPVKHQRVSNKVFHSEKVNKDRYMANSFMHRMEEQDVEDYNMHRHQMAGNHTQRFSQLHQRGGGHFGEYGKVRTSHSEESQSHHQRQTQPEP